MILPVLLHKGRGGGLSDMFGGGMSSSLGGSSVAERNLDRITVGVALGWFTVVGRLGGPARFAGAGRGRGLVVTRSGGRASVQARWARPSAARSRPGCTSRSGAPTGTRPGRA